MTWFLPISLPRYLKVGVAAPGRREARGKKDTLASSDAQSRVTSRASHQISCIHRMQFERFVSTPDWEERSSYVPLGLWKNDVQSRSIWKLYREHGATLQTASCRTSGILTRLTMTTLSPLLAVPSNPPSLLNHCYGRKLRVFRCQKEK